MGGPNIGDSFSFSISGERTVEILSSFYGVAELAQGSIPERKMVWLTQGSKERSPARYKMTEAERRQKAARKAAAARKAKAGVKMTRRERLPLVVPLRDKAGQIVFRMAPLTTAKAWIHPGIAKFTFAQRAIRKAKEQCIEVLKEAAMDAFMDGDPTQ